MPLSTSVKNFFKFFLPVALWCYIYRGFLWGKLYVSEDTFAIYAIVKYFITNLKEGIFAHWNPYIHWGMGHICQIGEYNPMWLLTYLMNLVGVDIYHSFLWTVIAYMLLGVFGVYRLIRLLFKESFFAYLGFIFFLFSNFSMTVFTQMTYVMLFVPAIWFFYFLGDFYLNRKSSSFMLMSFCLMLIVTTYIPFYFLTVFLLMLILGAVLFPKVIWNMICSVRDFIVKQPKLFIIAFVFVAGAMGMSFLNWLFIKTDFIVFARPPKLTYDIAKISGIPISEIMRDNSLFSALIQLINNPNLADTKSIFRWDAINFDNQRIFYMPLMLHVLIVLGLFSKLCRRVLLWAAATFILFLIASTHLTGFYGFLFQHVSFFHMFRNVFFLIPFLTVLYILLALETSKGALLGILDRLKGFKTVGKFVLIILTLYMPYFVLSTHAKKFEQMEPAHFIIEAIKDPIRSPSFAFVRPKSNAPGLAPNDVYRLYNLHMIAMLDTDRFITFEYGYPTTYASTLAKSYDKSLSFQEYVRHKLVLYDNFFVDIPFKDPNDFLEWKQAMPHGEWIESKNQGIVINRFNANQLHVTVTLNKPRFLVYNDSYHPFWKAYVNGKPVKLYKTNYAFKGVKVPEGNARVHFEFEPFGGNWLYIFFLVFSYCFFAGSLYLRFLRKF